MKSIKLLNSQMMKFAIANYHLEQTNHFQNIFRERIKESEIQIES